MILALCLTANAQQHANVSSHDQLIAHAQRTYDTMMLRFDEAMREDLLAQHKQIVADASKVQPELQQGYITQRDNDAKAAAEEERADYARQIETALTKIIDKQVEDDRWEELFRRLDQLPNQISAKVAFPR